MRAFAWLSVVGLALTPLGCGLVLGLEEKIPFPAEAGAPDGAVAEEGAPPLDGARTEAGDANVDPCAKCGVSGCVGGTCQVFTLATTPITEAGSVQNPLAVAAWNGHVYWATNHGYVYACERDNCSATAKAIAAPGVSQGYATEERVYSLLVDDVWVYWAQYYTGRIFRVGHDGGTVDSLDGRGNVGAMVADDQNVYWVNYGAGSSSLYRCAKAECFTQPLATTFMTDPYVAQTKPDPEECTEPENRCWFAMSLADDVSSLAFVDSKKGRFGDVYSILKSAADAGVKAWSNLEHPFPNPTSVTAHNGTIYFAAARGSVDDGGVVIEGNVTALTEQFGPNPIVYGVDVQPTSLTTDGVDLFWYAEGAGEIHACGVGGCSNAPRTLATNQPGAQSLFAANGTLYWVNSESIEVQMLVVR